MLCEREVSHYPISPCRIATCTPQPATKPSNIALLVVVVVVAGVVTVAVVVDDDDDDDDDENEDNGIDDEDRLMPRNRAIN